MKVRTQAKQKKHGSHCGEKKRTVENLHGFSSSWETSSSSPTIVSASVSSSLSMAHHTLRAGSATFSSLSSPHPPLPFTSFSPSSSISPVNSVPFISSHPSFYFVFLVSNISTPLLYHQSPHLHQCQSPRSQTGRGGAPHPEPSLSSPSLQGGSVSTSKSLVSLSTCPYT